MEYLFILLATLGDKKTLIKNMQYSTNIRFGSFCIKKNSIWLILDTGRL